MNDADPKNPHASPREKFLSSSLESTRKSYYPQLKEQLELARYNERRLQLLIDNMPARISYMDLERRYVLANLAYEQAFGRKRAEIVGSTVESILGSREYEKVRPHMEAAFRGSTVRFELTGSQPDGTPRCLEVTYVPDKNDQGEVIGLYVLSLDISEKKRAAREKEKLEGALQQIQKQKAIGTLAGGIAHDFNNLMTGIRGRTSLMALDMDPAHPHREHIDAIETYIDSAVALTRQLLGLARGGKYEVRPVDINDLIRQSAHLFGRARKEITLHTSLDPGNPTVEADRRQLEQVLVNLYVNAWQAMPDGGDLYLESRIVSLDGPYCGAREIQPGPYVKVSVTDTGIGMDAATCQRVFDPFFTTKEMGRGTGLGLASAFGIVKNHGGAISVYSEPGSGATFTLHLPLSRRSVKSSPRKDDTLVRGSGTILLVDDEEIVVQVGGAMLEKLGYRVMTATSGSQALTRVRRMGDGIDLVILDMIMPGMDGGQTFDRIREIRPALPVILSSGYSANGKAGEILKRGCNGFIQKPFNLSELSQRIQTVLKEQT